MSDFDKFFADKLGEESQFPRREKNWRALSKRLDAFDTGLQHHVGKTRRYLHYWQAIAACTLVAAAWLSWKMLTLQKENAGLHREMATIQEKNAAAEQEIALLERRLTVDKSSAAASPAGIEKISTPASVAQQAGGKENRKWSSYQLPGNTNGVQAIADRTENKAIADNDLTPSKTSTPENNPLSGGQTSAGDSAVAQVADEANLPHAAAPLPDSNLRSVAAVLQPDAAQKSPSLPLPDTMAMAEAPKLIEPVRNPSRFRAGIQILTGFPVPSQKGVSWMVGNGINAEYNLWRTFWLTASADWLRYDVSTEEYIPKFHSHHHNDPTPGGGPHEKLVRVESTQRQQQYALGIRYPLPVRSWIRPAVRVAYSMTHTSPNTITFEFEDQSGGGPGPGGPHFPKYKVQETDSQLIGNIWRFGAGLEHETLRWSFGLWADYSKNFAANNPTFDALQFRAGLQYTFN